MKSEEVSRLVEEAVSRLVSGFGTVTFRVQNDRVVQVVRERTHRELMEAISEVRLP